MKRVCVVVGVRIVLIHKFPFFSLFVSVTTRGMTVFIILRTTVEQINVCMGLLFIGTVTQKMKKGFFSPIKSFCEL